MFILTVVLEFFITSKPFGTEDAISFTKPLAGEIGFSFYGLLLSQLGFRCGGL
jgi:hypothetical protein